MDAVSSTEIPTRYCDTNCTLRGKDIADNARGFGMPNVDDMDACLRIGNVCIVTLNSDSVRAPLGCDFTSDVRALRDGYVNEDHAASTSHHGAPSHNRDVGHFADSTELTHDPRIARVGNVEDLEARFEIRDIGVVSSDGQAPSLIRGIGRGDQPDVLWRADIQHQQARLIRRDKAKVAYHDDIPRDPRRRQAPNEPRVAGIGNVDGMDTSFPCSQDCTGTIERDPLRMPREREMPEKALDCRHSNVDDLHALRPNGKVGKTADSSDILG